MEDEYGFGAENDGSGSRVPSRHVGFVDKLRSAASGEGNPGVLHDGEEMFMAGDCGGTTARLMLYAIDADTPILEKQSPPGRLIFEHKYPNILFKSLESIVGTFFEMADEASGTILPRPKVCVLAIAGIVTDNQCRYTNLDWVVIGDDIGEKFGIEEVEIINDFVAQGYGMLTLSDDEVEQLNDAEPSKHAPICCLGAGTGLGTTFLTPGVKGDYRAFPSEGGHIEFAPRDDGSSDLQVELLKFLKIKVSGYSRVSIERVVSGMGICNVYEFLAWKFPDRVNETVHDQHRLNPRDTSIIALNATPGSLCEQALQIFASCYGAYAGSIGIMFMPRGGLYITGGVTKRLLDFIKKDGSFMKAYMDKGRVSPTLLGVPLYLVLGDDMGQRGSRLRSVRLLREAQDFVKTCVSEPGSPSSGAPVHFPVHHDKGKRHTISELVAPRGLDPSIKEIAMDITEYQASELYKAREAKGLVNK